MSKIPNIKFMNSIGGRLKTILREKGIKQKELASALDMPEATVSNILKDKAEPSVVKIMLIASYLHIDLNWLITGEEFQNNSGGYVFHTSTVNEPPGAYASRELKELIEAIKQLTPQEQKKLLQIIHITFLNEERE